jgi:hypothetical protein
MLCEQTGVHITQLAEEWGRTLDVGQDEGDEPEGNVLGRTAVSAEVVSGAPPMESVLRPPPPAALLKPRRGY